MLVGLALVDPHHTYDMAMPVPWSFRVCATRQISICCCTINADSVPRASILVSLALRSNGLSSKIHVFNDQMTLGREDIGRLLQISREIDRSCSRTVLACNEPAIFFFLFRMLLCLS